MKKIQYTLFAMLVMACISTTANAQFMLRLGLGYTGNFATSTFIDTNVDPKTTTSTMVGGGRGMNIQLGVGYAFSEFVGAELGLGYLGMMGKSVDYTGMTAGSMKETWTPSLITVTPSLVLCPFESQFAPYTRMGLFMGFGSIKDETVTTASNISSTTTSKMSGGMAFGLQGALGLRYKLGDKLAIFGEMTMTNASWAPSAWENTLKTDAATVTTSGTYVDNPDATSTTQMGTIHIPLNNLGFMVGVSMSF